MNILRIDASASDAAASHSRRLSAELVEKLTVANPGASVVFRDVVVDRLPHVDMTIRQAWAPEGERDDALTATMARSKELVSELKVADVIGRRGPPFPLGHGLRVDPVALGEAPQAFLTMLYRSTDCRCRCGAPVVNLAHSASFHACEKIAPLNSEIKHLAEPA